MPALELWSTGWKVSLSEGSGADLHRSRGCSGPASRVTFHRRLVRSHDVQELALALLVMVAVGSSALLLPVVDGGAPPPGLSVAVALVVAWFAVPLAIEVWRYRSAPDAVHAGADGLTIIAGRRLVAPISIPWPAIVAVSPEIDVTERDRYAQPPDTVALFVTARTDRVVRVHLAEPVAVQVRALHAYARDRPDSA